MKPLHITYGTGRIETQPGAIDGVRCIAIKDTGIDRPVGATDLDEPGSVPQDYYDVVLLFKNIEGARLLQDILNELVSKWSREIAPRNTIHATAPQPANDQALPQGGAQKGNDEH